MAQLLLLSGMGADARVFQPQLLRFSQAVCPPWLTPLHNESLADYAKRFADDLRRITVHDEALYLGGASFGGFVAAEMARYLPVRALLLIGSARSPAELPPNIRALRPLAKAPATIPFSLVRPMCRLILSAPDSSIRPITKQVFQQVADADAQFLRWACGAVLGWRENPKPLKCPVYHVHGTADRTLPIRFTQATHVVRGGGHVLSLTHASRVNEIIGEMLGEH